MADSIGSALKEQSKAILIMVGLAIMSVLAMVILNQFSTSFVSAVPYPYNTTVSTTITAFIAGFALVGTFATVTMLIIVVKAIISVVKNMQ